MQTPYQILQLKQKQRKKCLSESIKQSLFNTIYDKSGRTTTRCYIQKQKEFKVTKKQRNKSQVKQEKAACQKKYQIKFRQSIRKVNNYRSKVYHTHSAFRNQNFMNHLITMRQDQSPRNEESTQVQKASFFSRNPYKRLKSSNPQQKCQTLNVGKYKIILMPNSQNNYLNFDDKVPLFSVQKCRINLNSDENKNKITKVIQSLREHTKSIQKQRAIKKNSLNYSNTTQRDFNSEQAQRKKSNIGLQSPKQAIQVQRGRRATIQISNNIKYLPQKTGDLQVANFIKYKKKKRLPLSFLRPKCTDPEQFQFRRTTTGQLSSKVQKQQFINDTQERYYSPNKKIRQGTKIKFNSIEHNISGWQFQPCYNLKSNMETPQQAFWGHQVDFATPPR